jgi:hypothetical protein
LLDDVVATVEVCAEQGVQLKNQYDDLLKSDNFTELQADHSDILDAIGEVAETGAQMKSEIELNGEKLDRILVILERQQ